MIKHINAWFKTAKRYIRKEMCQHKWVNDYDPHKGQFKYCPKCKHTKSWGIQK